MRQLIRRENSKVVVTLRAGGYSDVIRGYGHPGLSLSDNTSIVIRKSEYMCPRTLMIRADKSALNISRELISKLRSSFSELLIEISVIA